MKLSRKPKNLLVMLLIAVFLMSFSGIAMAVQDVNWGTWLNFSKGATINGTVYETDSAAVGGNVYANVYATIGGYTLPTPVNVNQYIYGNGSAFSIPLYSFTGLVVGQNYTVNLKVYSGSDPQSISTTVYTPYTSKSFILTSSGGGTGGGGGVVTTPTTPTTPSLSATFGSPVSVSATTGATINATGVTLEIPAGALAADVKVTVSKVANTAGLKLDAGSKLVSDVLEIIKDKTGNFSKPVTITLSFDKSKVDTDKFDLKVCYYDEANNKWVPLDSISVDLANGKVSGKTTHFTKFAVIAFPKEAEKPEAKGLSDIAGHWAADSIKQLVASGAIAGYPDGTFKPNKSITRAEFATVVVKAFKLNAANGKVFADTSTHWAKSYIATAEAAGIVNGYGNNKFGPNDLITREQMAVMIVKAANLTGDSGKTFTDSAKIASWAKSAVSITSATGVISGFPDGSFKPQDKATRAQAVTIIVNAQK